MIANFYLLTCRGISTKSNPLRMMLYTFMGSEAVKGGLATGDSL